jgi:hypothetical protein
MSRLACFHFTREAVLGGFSSMKKFIGGVEAVLVNHLAKQLYI